MIYSDGDFRGRCDACDKELPCDIGAWDATWPSREDAEARAEGLGWKVERDALWCPACWPRIDVGRDAVARIPLANLQAIAIAALEMVNAAEDDLDLASDGYWAVPHEKFSLLDEALCPLRKAARS